jgi:presenilin 1
MILSALAVVYINTDETRAQGEAAYAQAYQALDLEEGNSAQNFAASLANVLIMVSVVCFMTFVIVILYKYGCTKIFLGYMIVVMTMLLGYFTSSVALVAIEKYQIRVDKISFAYIIWNYTIVGVLAIFFNQGIPKFVTQGYLVTSSVVLAWQLSYFNDWTAWTLLVMLALYDLFAVLSPYGPLRKLVQLMSRPGARPLPGLLYEASLPLGVQRPHGNATTMAASDQRQGSNANIPAERNQGAVVNQNIDDVLSSTDVANPSRSSPERLPEEEPPSTGMTHVRTTQSLHQSEARPGSDPSLQSAQHVAADSVAPRDDGFSTRQENREDNRGKVALAIAKLYKLDVIDEVGVLRKRGERDFPRRYPAEEIRQTEWTPKQLRAEVTVIFPRRGGQIVPAASDAQNSSEGKKYLVYNRGGELLRTFVVNRQGKVLQVVRRETDENESPDDNTIKLGLGDFIFYSVLVSKAAIQSYAAFICCMLTILFGLGATLVLLAVHGKALPGTWNVRLRLLREVQWTIRQLNGDDKLTSCFIFAALPISIFLAVIVFVLTMYVGEPFIQTLMIHSLYV